ncbi:autotransporter domain-containing protein [Aquabacter sp. L1I39]|uniref:autotransporter domain-containing protein n=1 Tax=Aquabacter sp. L1I39 TaxID=2820278 RepID=UPI001ADCAACF|nr:autotransporter domain-containing protein [Aquabacter sp. L1I39]
MGTAGRLTFEPSLGFDWYRLIRCVFLEAGAGAAGLNVGSQTIDLIVPSVGVHQSTLIDAGAFTLTPELSARHYCRRHPCRRHRPPDRCARPVLYGDGTGPGAEHRRAGRRSAGAAEQQPEGAGAI